MNSQYFSPPGRDPRFAELEILIAQQSDRVGEQKKSRVPLTMAEQTQLQERTMRRKQSRAASKRGYIR
jgi:hypothetical protein